MGSLSMSEDEKCQFTCSTSRISGIFSRRPRSSPIFIVIVLEAQDPPAPSSVPSDATREKTRLPKASVLRQPAPSIAPGESERRRSTRQAEKEVETEVDTAGS